MTYNTAYFYSQLITYIQNELSGYNLYCKKNTIIICYSARGMENYDKAIISDFSNDYVLFWVCIWGYSLELDPVSVYTYGNYVNNFCSSRIGYYCYFHMMSNLKYFHYWSLFLYVNCILTFMDRCWISIYKTDCSSGKADRWSWGSVTVFAYE